MGIVRRLLCKRKRRGSKEIVPLFKRMGKKGEEKVVSLFFPLQLDNTWWLICLYIWFNLLEHNQEPNQTWSHQEASRLSLQGLVLGCYREVRCRTSKLGHYSNFKSNLESQNTNSWSWKVPYQLKMGYLYLQIHMLDTWLGTEVDILMVLRLLSNKPMYGLELGSPRFELWVELGAARKRHGSYGKGCQGMSFSFIHEGKRVFLHRYLSMSYFNLLNYPQKEFSVAHNVKFTSKLHEFKLFIQQNLAKLGSKKHSLVNIYLNSLQSKRVQR